MSTKTTFKRIALVAVAALGLGVLSVAPSQAAAAAVTLVPSATTTAITTSETATITIATSAVAGGSTDSLTVRAVVTSSNVATAGTLRFAGTTDSTTTIIRAAVASPASITLDSATVTAGQLIRGSVKLNLITPSAAGTYTVYVYSTSGGTSGASSTAGVDQAFTWTVTVTAPSTSADGTTTSVIMAGQGAGTWGVVDAVVTASKAGLSTTTNQGASIKVVQANATGTANEPLNVFVSGPGYIVAAADTVTANTANKRSLQTTGASQNYILVFADGTAGATTITIVGSVTGTVLGTETLTFSDTKPASITATTAKAYIAAGATTASVFSVTVKDAAGNAITGTSAVVTGTRTDTTTAGKAIATANLSCAWSSVYLAYHCSATGASTIKFGPAAYSITATGTDADETVVTAANVTTTFADTVATSVTITGPGSATVGEKITYTLTAKEKNGYPVADASYEGGTANGSNGIFWNTTTAPAYTSSAVAPFNAGETITTVSGVASKSLYVPAVAGTVSATWTLAGSAAAPAGAIDKSIAGTTITVDTVIGNPGVDAATDAANEATDAANAATDAALAAADSADAATEAAQEASDAVAELSTQVAALMASLKAQIKSLTNLVIKIQKKLK
jgi:trimeric autotransporter adhesin